MSVPVSSINMAISGKKIYWTTAVGNVYLSAFAGASAFPVERENFSHIRYIRT